MNAEHRTRLYPAIPNPELTKEEFHARWRAHAELAQTRPGWTAIASYEQFRVSEGVQHDHPWEGVCVAQLAPASDLSALKELPSMKILLEDELEIFAGPVDSFAVNTVSEQLYSAPGAALARVMCFYGPQSHILSSDVLGEFGEIPGILSVHNHVAIEAGASVWSGVLEIGCANAATARSVRTVGPLAERSNSTITIDPFAAYSWG